MTETSGRLYRHGFCRGCGAAVHLICCVGSLSAAKMLQEFVPQAIEGVMHSGVQKCIQNLVYNSAKKYGLQCRYEQNDEEAPAAKLIVLTVITSQTQTRPHTPPHINHSTLIPVLRRNFLSGRERTGGRTQTDVRRQQPWHVQHRAR